MTPVLHWLSSSLLGTFVTRLNRLSLTRGFPSQPGRASTLLSSDRTLFRPCEEPGPQGLSAYQIEVCGSKGRRWGIFSLETAQVLPAYAPGMCGFGQCSWQGYEDLYSCLGLW